MQISKENTKASMLSHQRCIQTIHKRKYINDKLELKKKKLECLGKDKANNMFI